MSTKANILTIAIIVLLVVAVGQCAQNAGPAKAAPPGAKAGDVCAVSKDGDGNVYKDTYEDRDPGPGKDLVCTTSKSTKVGTEDRGERGETFGLYATTVAKVFPTVVINNPIGSDTNCGPLLQPCGPPAPTPVAGCSEAEILAADAGVTDDPMSTEGKQYGHAHPGGGSNSQTGFMTRAEACDHDIYHRKEWKDTAWDSHNHFFGEDGGEPHSH